MFSDLSVLCERRELQGLPNWSISEAGIERYTYVVLMWNE